MSACGSEEDEVAYTSAYHPRYNTPVSEMNDDDPAAARDGAIDGEPTSSMPTKKQGEMQVVDADADADADVDVQAVDAGKAEEVDNINEALAAADAAAGRAALCAGTGPMAATSAIDAIDAQRSSQQFNVAVFNNLAAADVHHKLHQQHNSVCRLPSFEIWPDGRLVRIYLCLHF